MNLLIIDLELYKERYLASIAGIDLMVSDSRFVAGAAFRLSKVARTDANLTLEDETQAFVRAGQNYIIVALPNAPSNLDELLMKTHEAAQRTLDIFSVQGIDDINLPEGHQEQVIWQRQNGQVKLRYTFRLVMDISVNPIEVVVRDSNGNVKSNTKVASPNWNNAFRYYRLSQTTDDLYDSYRNMYLAFEAALSEAVPLVKPEGEAAWLRRALSIISNKINLSPYVSSGTSDSVEEAFIQEQYKSHRCALFHAKTGATHIVPGSFSFDERQQVVQALERLTELVKRINAEYLSANSPGGGMTLHAFSSIIAPFKDQLILAVSEDDTPFDAEQTKPSPKELPISNLETSYVGNFDGVGYELAFFGKIQVNQLSVVAINSVACYLPEGLIGRSTLEAPLLVENVAEFEVMCVFVLNNTRQPKTRFSL